jgi:hypothetical protein
VWDCILVSVYVDIMILRLRRGTMNKLAAAIKVLLKHADLDMTVDMKGVHARDHLIYFLTRCLRPK